MNKNIWLLFIVCLGLLKCTNQSKVNQSFHCKTSRFEQLEKLRDVKKLFSIELPKTWNTNFYYDTLQSSIYTADTTKQLTETLLLDITIIKQNIKFDNAFKIKQQDDELSKNLIKVKSEEITLLKHTSYYRVSRGKKGKYNYHVGHFFIKINEQYFIHAKTEVYGDSLINNRLCDSIELVGKIKLIEQND